MFYKEALERLKREVSTAPEAPVAPKESGKGFISPRLNTSKPEEEQSGPLEISKQWLSIIKESSEIMRKKTQAQAEEAMKTGGDPNLVSTPSTVAVAEEAVPETAPNEGKRDSIFGGLIPRPGQDDMDVFSLEYNGPKSEWVSKARLAAQQHNIPEELFLKLVNQESGFQPGVSSSAGAIGLAQLMPGTADYLGVNPHNPTQNLEGGARYLKEQYDKFGNWSLALAAYNAGPGAVEKHGGIPPYEETQNYVRSILGN